MLASKMSVMGPEKDREAPHHGCGREATRGFPAGTVYRKGQKRLGRTVRAAPPRPLYTLSRRRPGPGTSACRTSRTRMCIYEVGIFNAHSAKAPLTRLA